MNVTNILVDEPVYGTVGGYLLPNGPESICGQEPLDGHFSFGTLVRPVALGIELGITREEAHALMLRTWTEDPANPGPKFGDGSRIFEEQNSE